MKFRFPGLLAMWMAGPAAFSEITFNFDYSGSADFSSGPEAPARRAALEDAAAKLGRIFNHTVVLEITVLSNNDPLGDLLAVAGSNYVEPPFDFYGYDQGVVMAKVLTGIDKNGSDSDGVVEVNFGFDWDLDDEVSPDFFDFKATIIHELLHTMGFGSGVFMDGGDVFGVPPGNPGVWECFDDFLSDKDGVELIDDSTFALDGMAWNSVREGGPSPAGGLFFNGPKAMAANDGQPVGLYSPDSWKEGSSGSHLDDENPALEGLLMLASTDTGRYRRSLGDVERAILMDLGFLLHPLPDPAVAIQSIDPGNSVVLDLTGPEDRWYAVECSDDLDDWDELEVIEMAGGSVTVTVPLTTMDKARFFRLRETGLPATSARLRIRQGRARR